MCNIWPKFHNDIQPNNDFILFKQPHPQDIYAAKEFKGHNEIL